MSADLLRKAAAKLHEVYDDVAPASDGWVQGWLAVADLLAAAADLIDARPELAREHVDGEPCEDLACRVVTPARAAARKILGEVPDEH